MTTGWERNRTVSQPYRNCTPVAYCAVRLRSAVATIQMHVSIKLALLCIDFAESESLAITNGSSMTERFSAKSMHNNHGVGTQPYSFATVHKLYTRGLLRCTVAKGRRNRTDCHVSIKFALLCIDFAKNLSVML